MGRKPIEDSKVSKSIRLKKSDWERIEKEKEKLNHEYVTNTLEHIIHEYFKKQQN